jgi:hypothetical protein
MDTVKENLNEAQNLYLKLLLDAGCKFLFATEHFGKPYVWMRDPHGSTFMERLPDEV